MTLDRTKTQQNERKKSTPLNQLQFQPFTKTHLSSIISVKSKVESSETTKVLGQSISEATRDNFAMIDSSMENNEFTVETDMSSQKSGIKDVYEQKFNALQMEISELKDLMITMLQKSSNTNPNPNEPGP